MGRQGSGWSKWRFDQMAVSVKDRVDDPSQAQVEYYIGLEHLDSDSLKIRRWGTPDEVSATKLLFRPGDIIFGRRRAYQRKLGVAEFHGIASAHSLVLRAKPAVALPEFLPFLMQSDLFMELAQRISVGSLSPTINWKTLAKQEFALPSLGEQARIAAILTASDAFREDLLRTLRASTIARLSIRDSVTRVEDARSLPLGALCQMQNGRPFPSKQYQEDGVRLLRPGNLAPDGSLNWAEDKTVCLPESWIEEASDHVVRDGDVCINLTAQSLEDGFMGRVVKAQEGDKCLLNQRIGRFVAIRDDLRSEWLFRVLQSTRFLRHAASRCEGTKVQHLFWSHLEDFEVPVPPLGEQDVKLAVVKELDEAVIATERRLAEHQSAHRALRESLLSPTKMRGVA